MNKNKSDLFGPVLRQFRNALNLTQEEVGEQVGVAGAFISMLESSQKYPNLEMLFKLAEALKVRASVLVSAMEERERK